MSGDRTLLLTGASGVCGRAILERPPAGTRLVCLVHREPVAAEGVECVVGDIRDTRLGMPDHEYRSLASRVDAVVHSAAITNFAAREDVVRPVNVDGTRHVLEFADHAAVPIYYFSTAFVDWTNRPVAEHAPTAYEASKIEAERLVLESGLQTIVLRPSGVMGDSRTGRISRFQGMYMLANVFLQGQLPIAPTSPDTYFDLVPQDVVAEVLARLVELDVREGEFWITAGEDALTLRDLVDECVGYAQSVGRPIHRPRFVAPDMFDRLIRPVFLPELPPRMRVAITRVLDIFTNFNTSHPFPTSLPELQRTLGLHLPDGRSVFRRSLEYWGAASGFEAGGQRRRTGEDRTPSAGPSA